MITSSLCERVKWRRGEGEGVGGSGRSRQSASFLIDNCLATVNQPADYSLIACAQTALTTLTPSQQVCQRGSCDCIRGKMPLRKRGATLIQLSYCCCCCHRSCIMDHKDSSSSLSRTQRLLTTTLTHSQTCTSGAVVVVLMLASRDISKHTWSVRLRSTPQDLFFLNPLYVFDVFFYKITKSFTKVLQLQSNEDIRAIKCCLIFGHH